MIEVIDIIKKINIPSFHKSGILHPNTPINQLSGIIKSIDVTIMPNICIIHESLINAKTLGIIFNLILPNPS
jgi:hypothetical protein